MMMPQKTSPKQDYNAAGELLFEKALGYYFVDRLLLKQALTHRSYGTLHNERLEFLGDGILNYVIARMLYERFPSFAEGELSLFRAQLVNQRTLSDIARRIKLGEQLFLSEGEAKSGGANRASILADALEALFAAISLDSDFASSEKAIRYLFLRRINRLNVTSEIKDAKTMLQEKLQSQRLPLPAYAVIKQLLRAKKSWFEVSCTITQPSMQKIGRGSTRRLAEQKAASAVLAELKKL